MFKLDRICRIYLLIFIIFLCTSCSAIIAKVGMDTNYDVNTQDASKITTDLGKPFLVYQQLSDSRKVEVYKQTGRLRGDSYGYMVLSSMTFGIAELFLFPYELFRLSTDVFRTHYLYLYYNEEGFLTCGRRSWYPPESKIQKICIAK